METQTEITQPHTIPVLLLASPTGSCSASHWLSMVVSGFSWLIPALCSDGWYHHVPCEHNAFPSVFSILHGPWRCTLKAL